MSNRVLGAWHVIGDGAGTYTNQVGVTNIRVSLTPTIGTTPEVRTGLPLYVEYFDTMVVATYEGNTVTVSEDGDPKVLKVEVFKEELVSLFNTNRELVEKLNSNFAKLDSGKVDAATGKVLSANDFTSANKTKLEELDTGANKIVVDASMSDSSTNPVQNKVIKEVVDNITIAMFNSLLGDYAPIAQRGANSGIATLGSDSKIPQAQLPSYVDDVLEYATQTSFPSTGEAGKIYVAQDTNKTYRWGGSAYTEISASLAIGITAGTAFAGDRGKTVATKVSGAETSLANLSTRTTELENKQLEKTKITFTATTDTTSSSQPNNVWWKEPNGSDDYYRYKYMSADQRLMSDIYNSSGEALFVEATDTGSYIEIVSDGAFAGYFYIL